MLRGSRVDVGERHTLEGEIPCCEPRVFPLVGHHEKIMAVQVPPLFIAYSKPSGWRRRFGRIAFLPAQNVEVIELLAPDQPRERLAHDRRFFVGGACRPQRRIVFVRFLAALGERQVKIGAQVEGAGCIVAREAKPELDALPGATVRRCQHAIFVPFCAGFTVAAPATT